MSCTTKKSSTETLLHKSLQAMQWPSENAAWFCNNRMGLSKRYNEALKTYGKDYKCMVFVHDDVYIDDALLESKLQQAMQVEKYDIVGLAGTLNPKIQYPSLWHIMGDRSNHRGYAGHITNDQKKFMTGFGVTPSRVAIADGLFIAVNVEAVLSAGWQWNENFDFHHYDIASCIDANAKSLKVGVYPINVFHNSPGLESLQDVAWSKSNEKFLQMYGQHAK